MTEQRNPTEIECRIIDALDAMTLPIQALREKYCNLVKTHTGVMISVLRLSLKRMEQSGWIGSQEIAGGGGTRKYRVTDKGNRIRDRMRATEPVEHKA